MVPYIVILCAIVAVAAVFGDGVEFFSGSRGGLTFWLPPAQNTFPRTFDTFEHLDG